MEHDDNWSPGDRLWRVARVVTYVGLVVLGVLVYGVVHECPWLVSGARTEGNYALGVKPDPNVELFMIPDAGQHLLLEERITEPSIEFDTAPPGITGFSWEEVTTGTVSEAYDAYFPPEDDRPMFAWSRWPVTMMTQVTLAEFDEVVSQGPQDGHTLFQFIYADEIIMSVVLEQRDPIRVRVIYDSESEALTVGRQPDNKSIIEEVFTVGPDGDVTWNWTPAMFSAGEVVEGTAPGTFVVRYDTTCVQFITATLTDTKDGRWNVTSRKVDCP